MNFNYLLCRDAHESGEDEESEIERRKNEENFTDCDGGIANQIADLISSVNT